MKQTVTVNNETAPIITATIRSHRSHRPQLRYNRPSHRDSDRLDPIRSGKGPSGHPRTSNDINRSHSVSAGIYLMKGGKSSCSEGYMNSKTYHYIDIDTYMGTNTHDDVGTVPELGLHPVDDKRFGLTPLNTRSENDLGGAMAMADVSGVKDLPRPP